ncbi:MULTISPECIES: protoglobin domain-containing protein [unclassified Paenibacillus]|uniref:protoglobin domain-containing protein n=2 Tax=Paenibacillus TaxID=44249 RepID=UPI0025A25144|nr:protoglobin domain-containing protein [Paenibacillus sp. S-12]
MNSVILRKPMLPHSITESDIVVLDSLRTKMNFLQITSKDAECLRRLAPYMEKYAEAITDRHYDLLFELPEMKQMIDQHSTRARLKGTFVSYLKSIPQVAFDEEYVQMRERIGQVHSRIQLEPEWFIASFLRVYEYLVPIIVSDFRSNDASAILMALHRIVMLDAQIVLESYQSATEYRLMDNNSDIMEMLIQTDGLHTMLTAAERSLQDVMDIQAATEQLTASIEEVAAQTADSATNTENMIAALQENRTIVEETIEGFEMMNDLFLDTRTRFDQLQRSMQKLTDVVHLIDTVAGETQLLALNASIEAARAGEEGRGFAVVAGEVRKLSDQTKVAVHDVYEVIETIQGMATAVQERTEDMSVQMDIQHNKNKSAFEQLERMMQTVKEVGSTEDAIAAIVEQQADATQEITAGMTGIVKNTEEMMSTAKSTGLHIYTTSQSVEALRKKSLEWFRHLDEAQWIRIMKTDHMLWKWCTYNRLLGFDESDPAVMENFHQCRLGKWIEKEQSRKDSTVANLPEFKEMVALHEKLHRLAGEVARQIDIGHRDTAITAYREMSDISQELLTQLDVLRSQLERRPLKKHA